MFPTTKTIARVCRGAAREMRMRLYEYRHLPEEDKRKLAIFAVASVLIVALLVSAHQTARWRLLDSGYYPPIERALLADLIRNTTGYH